MIEGKRISDHFEILQRLGQGGMATVYLGRDTHTQQKVAIKQLKPEVIQSDPDIVARFEREGEALRRLNHPNIVKVLATAEEDGQHFVIMEYVGGGDLGELIAQYRQRDEFVPISRVLEIALDLSDALARAHRLKIIHRDIKPANVLLAEDGTPRLTDFGVAHFGDATRMTQSGTVIGTLSYLSPEACAGFELDPRADIWAFGVMLYELLTLNRPFGADNTAALLNAILTGEPESLAAQRPDVPPALVALVEQMLVKDRDERIGSVRMVGAQLEAMISGKSIPTETPHTPPTPYPFHTKTLPDTIKLADDIPKGLKKRYMLLGALLALIVVAMGLFALQSHRSKTPDKTDAAALVEPISEGEYMVLVAKMEHVGGTERDVSRFIADDLRRKFEEDVPFSDIRIRIYPEVITTKSQALSVAEATGATVILWGNYDDRYINVDVQLGVLPPTSETLFGHKTLERATDAQVRMTSERYESLVASVVAVMNIVYSGESDSYGTARNLAILDMADTNTLPEVLGSSAAAHWHRHLASYAGDSIADIDSLNAAIAMEGHPIFYLARSLVHQQRGELGSPAISNDYETAQRLGPEGWAMPQIAWGQHEIYFGGDPEHAIRLFDEALKTRPDDWWLQTVYGGAHYQIGNIDIARDVIDSVIAQSPPANFPYVFAVSIALYDGRIADAMTLTRTVQTRFPDPTFSTRLMTAGYGLSGTEGIYSVGMAAFGYFMLGQWSDVVTSTTTALALETGVMPDLYLLQGFAYCNLKDYTAAEESYTRLIEIMPDYAIVYAMRAEVRQKQGNVIGALADGAMVLQSAQAETLRPYLPAFQSGQISCETFFDTNLEALLAAEATESP